MLAVTLSEAGTKGFMQKLLTEDVFDGFDTRSVMVSSFARMEIDGAAEREGDEEGQAQPRKQVYSTWKALRPYVTQFVRGGGRPKGMKLVFSLAAEEMASRFPEASALFLNVLFDGKVVLTTGASQRSFSLDKALEYAWEDHVRSFLTANQIQFEMED